MSWADADVALNEERGGLRCLRCSDAMLDDETLQVVDGGRLRSTDSNRLRGRDLYLARLVGDRGPEEDEEDGREDRERQSDDSTQDSDRLEGRAAYLIRLEGLGDEYSRQYERSRSARLMNRRWMRR